MQHLDLEAALKVERVLRLVGSHAVQAVVVNAQYDFLLADSGNLTGPPEKCALFLAESVDPATFVQHNLGRVI